MKRLIFPATVLCAIGMFWSQPGVYADEDGQAPAPIKALYHTIDHMHEIGATDPAAAVTEGQEFLQQHPAIYADHLIMMIRAIAELQKKGLHDPAKSLATLSAGFNKYANVPARFLLLSMAAWSLLDDKKPHDTEVLVKSQWPQLMLVEPRFQLGAAQAYIQALEQQNREPEAIAALRDSSLSCLLFNYPANCYEPLINKLLEQNMLDEALSWAKADFETCDFTDVTVSYATRLLAKVWTSRDLTPVTAHAFAKAQTDPKLPNPLTAVPMPKLDSQMMQDRLMNLTPQQGDQRITIYILTQQWNKAMLEARRVLVDQPDSPDGLREVCRVFKAADLNLARANAFLDYYKTAQGTNPMIEFLQQHPSLASAAGQKP